jgi:hypothetical protein
MIDTKKYLKDKGLADVLLTGSRTKPIYLEELLNDFAQELVKKLTIPVVVGQSEQCFCERELGTTKDGKCLKGCYYNDK